MVCEAAVTGNKGLAITALAFNPLVDSDSVENKVFEEIFAAHRQYLKTIE